MAAGTLWKERRPSGPCSLLRASPTGFEFEPGSHGDTQEPNSADFDTEGDMEKHGGPSKSVGVGQSLAHAAPRLDSVEGALGLALKLAADAGQWSAVET